LSQSLFFSPITDKENLSHQHAHNNPVYLNAGAGALFRATDMALIVATERLGLPGEESSWLNAEVSSRKSRPPESA
jgi:hypothetical protein